MAQSFVNWSNVMDRLFEDLQNKKAIKDLIEILKRFADALKNVKVSILLWCACSFRSFQIETIEAAIAEGLFVGVMKNAAEFVVQVGGRASNIVNVFDKTAISSLGNPKWFARVDMPHGSVPFHHINVNPAITGLPDPHIRISPVAAQVAGFAGKVLSFLNKIAPYLTIILFAFEIYGIRNTIMKDLENGSYRNTVTKILTMIITILVGLGGAAGGMFFLITIILNIFAGGAIGTMAFPGIGTLIGQLIGGTIGGVIGAIGTESALNALFDYFEFDIETLFCKKCDKKFVNRRYEEGSQEFCRNCRN